MIFMHAFVLHPFERASFQIDVEKKKKSRIILNDKARTFSSFDKNKCLLGLSFSSHSTKTLVMIDRRDIEKRLLDRQTMKNCYQS